MESEALARVILRSYGISAIGALIVWILWDANRAAGLLFGGVWSATNLWAIKNLVEEICQTRRPWFLALVAQVKMPVLYGVGAWILVHCPLSIGVGIIGFHIPFILTLIESVYHVRRDERVAKAL